jgi:hypothetical protein
MKTTSTLLFHSGPISGKIGGIALGFRANWSCGLGANQTEIPTVARDANSDRGQTIKREISIGMSQEVHRVASAL